MAMRSAFEDQLARYGPKATLPSMTLKEAQKYCRHLAHCHYENFSIASIFLPKPLKEPFYAIYAYCRWADDLGDETGGGARALELLDWWKNGLNQCYAILETNSSTTPYDENRHPVFIALTEVIRRHHLPKQPFLDLLTAFRCDQQKTEYETMAELLEYCRFSANPVGRIILYLASSAWKTPPPNQEQLNWSDAICTGLQLANHWQDISRDRLIGRCYIPRSLMIQFEVDPAGKWAEPQFRDMIRFLVDDATDRLESGRPLIKSVPRPLQRDIALFLEGGLCILKEIRRIRFDVSHYRPKVSIFQKAILIFQACFFLHRLSVPSAGNKKQKKGVAPVDETSNRA